jgi:hypothetical protein
MRLVRSFWIDNPQLAISPPTAVTADGVLLR